MLEKFFKKSAYDDEEKIRRLGEKYNNNESKESKYSESENKIANVVMNWQTNAEAVKSNGNDSDDFSIEDIWDDEYKIYKGGGLQWSTNMAYRTKAVKKTRPNSEDNFVFNSIQIMHANITANIPEVSISGNESSDKEIAEKLTCILRFNDKRSGFRELWKKWVLDYITYGPMIGMVIWDNDWMGGSGPDRWIGDMKPLRINKKDFFPDPAIIDLEERLQECGYINRRIRKKLDWIKKRWKDKAHLIGSENNTDTMQYEGSSPDQAYIYESWTKGFPEYMPEERKKQLREKASMLEEEGDYYKAQDYYDMANGSIEGVHVAYVSNNVLLEYIPYVYDDGNYPFVYKTCYYDENNQWGFGEVRNIKIPQVLHNKADEIEIEAMSRQGLGGMYYRTGSVSSKQIDQITKNSGKGGMWLEVEDPSGLRDRDPVQVPNSVIGYKEHKQRMIETVSQVTPIMQGQAPGSNTPYRAIAELGARTDVRMKQKVEKLEDFLVELNKLRIQRVAQFYTEDRYYRIKGNDGKSKEGTFNNKQMFREWDREELRDESGNVYDTRKERFVPEFDITVNIINEKPTDRNYYTQTAFVLYDKQLLTAEDLWYTIEEGKFPNKDDVLQSLTERNMAMQIQQQIQQLPPDAQQYYMQAQQQLMQQIMQQYQMQQMQEQQMQMQMQQGQAQEKKYNDMQQSVIDAQIRKQMQQELEAQQV